MERRSFGKRGVRVIDNYKYRIGDGEFRSPIHFDPWLEPGRRSAINNRWRHIRYRRGGIYILQCGDGLQLYRLEHFPATSGTINAQGSPSSTVNLNGDATVTANFSGAPVISTQPKSQTIISGTSVTFNVAATGVTPLSYQWSDNGTSLPGATQATYTIANVQAANAGTYTVIVSNGILPNATSNGAVLTVVNQWKPAARTDLQFSGRMVLIKAAGYGFTMGSESSFDPGASPSHAVLFAKDYYIDTTDITQAQYQAVTGMTPSSFTGKNNDPVEQVSWYDAIRYCNQRSILDGLTSCYDTTTWNCTFTNNGYRLPTEAEWEYACRAGTTTGFYWGDDSSATAENYAWFWTNSNWTTQPVAQKLPNSYGIYDMSGNVWQWCNDWDTTYSPGAQTDPTGPPSGKNRVLRGGAWGNHAIRSAFRNANTPDIKSDGTGFRCVRR